MKTRRDPARTAAAPRSAADILFGKSEPRPNSRPETGIATNDRIKSGSRLGQQDRREETDTDIWSVKRRRVSSIDPEPPQVAEALVEELVDRSTSTEPSILDDTFDALKVITTPPSSNINTVEEEIRATMRLAAETGYSFPAGLLRHFLEGKGKALRVPASVALSFGPISGAQDKNQERFELSLTGEGEPGTKSFKKELLALKDGAMPTPLEDEWSAATTGLDLLKDLELSVAFGLGDFQLKSRGKFFANRQGNTITVTGMVTHGFEDDYDFVTGKPLSNFGDRGAILQNAGRGQVYEVKASWDKEFIATIEVVNGKLGTPSVEWKDLAQHPAVPLRPK